jgi:hypothetical protein
VTIRCPDPYRSSPVQKLGDRQIADRDAVGAWVKVTVVTG